MVQTLARETGVALRQDAVLRNNFSLEDHWNEGEALRRIRTGRWDVVVLQQGPSSLPRNQESLRLWSGRFAERIREAGARPALLTVWPPADRALAFEAVSRAYARAAESVDGLLLPAGDAWREAWRRDPSLPLYGPDGFHPSPMGTYLSALVVHSRLLGTPARSRRTVPGPGTSRARLTAEQAGILEASALPGAGAEE